jgi:AraC-like DNA-binding protein
MAVRYRDLAMPRFHAALARLRDADVPLVAVRGAAASRTTAAHAHSAGQLFGATRGVLTVGTARGRWVVPPSHVVWVPPHCEHDLRSHGAFDAASVYVVEASCAGLPGEPCALRTSGLLREAIARAASWGAGAWSAAQRRIADVILDEIRGLPREPIGLAAPSDPRALKVAHALIAHPGDLRDLAAWARWAAVSPRTLRRLFVAQTGHSFGAWRQRARLMRALELLAAGEPVTNVALELGYASLSAFIAMFRRVHGVTPARLFTAP